MTSYLTRRNVVLGGLGLIGAGFVAGRSLRKRPDPLIDHHGFDRMNPQNADEALERLIAGNKCFTSEHFDVANEGRTMVRREEVAPAQHPYAVILACADSRVAPEIVFTAGLGDLFVVRVAGNVVGPQSFDVRGSIEYATEELRIPLILVLGHENCGAVKAAVAYVEKGTNPESESIGAIVDVIRPAIETASQQPGALLANAISANVQRSVAKLEASNDRVASRAAAGDVKIVGGVYELGTGAVRLLG